MGTPHKATPQQWEAVESWVDGVSYSSCILELRDRIEALEAAASAASEQPPAAPAPAGGLVERVMLGGGLSHTEARAAILAVADWFTSKEWYATDDVLREEAQRHG